MNRITLDFFALLLAVTIVLLVGVYGGQRNSIKPFDSESIVLDGQHVITGKPGYSGVEFDSRVRAPGRRDESEKLPLKEKIAPPRDTDPVQNLPPR